MKSMKAAVVNAFGAPLHIEQVPIPEVTDHCHSASWRSKDWPRLACSHSC